MPTVAIFTSNYCAILVIMVEKTNNFSKGLVYFQDKNVLIIDSSPCHPRCACLSVENKLRFLRKIFQDFSLYGGR